MCIRDRGYASSVVTVITAVLGPILGTLADTRGFKKPIFMLCLFVGVAGCCAMGLATTWLPFLIIFILAKIGFSGSLVSVSYTHLVLETHKNSRDIARWSKKC